MILSAEFQRNREVSPGAAVTLPPPFLPNLVLSGSDLVLVGTHVLLQWRGCGLIIFFCLHLAFSCFCLVSWFCFLEKINRSRDREDREEGCRVPRPLIVSTTFWNLQLISARQWAETCLLSYFLVSCGGSLGVHSRSASFSSWRAVYCQKLFRAYVPNCSYLWIAVVWKF